MAQATAPILDFTEPDQPDRSDDVCLSGKTGSHRRTVKVTRLTHLGRKLPRSNRENIDRY